MPATSDANACQELAPTADKYDDWAQSAGFPRANRYIVTKYVDGNHSFHNDKPKSIEPSSLITVVKIGSHGHPFQLRDRVFLDRLPGEEKKGFKKRTDKAQANEKPFLDQTLAPGAAVIMTLEANLKTQRGVPVVDEAGPSGSLVFRTITERIALKRKAQANPRVAKRSRAAAPAIAE